LLHIETTGEAGNRHELSTLCQMAFCYRVTVINAVI